MVSEAQLQPQTCKYLREAKISPCSPSPPGRGLLGLGLEASSHRGFTLLPRLFTKLLSTETLLQGGGKYLNTQEGTSQIDPSFHTGVKDAQELTEMPVSQTLTVATC